MEVVVSVGIFAVAVLSILALLLPNTKSVADQIDAGVAQRLGENIQLELDRYGFTAVVGALPNKTSRIFMVATKDGERVLITGEDPYAAWNDTYGKYIPSASSYTSVSPALAAENDLIVGIPPGIAFRDRFFLIEVSWPDTYPQYQANSGAMPVNVRLLWPYRLPDGPPDSTATIYNQLPWLVVSPSAHNSLLFNFALKP
ncbi:hypothetical protein IMCC26134_00765 [Verrucomicrobia bacterium IMCC26134]|nr:hypothetical protein IMCC26134_00765 [Verrucomicrobia bacterium IMCC26134]